MPGSALGSSKTLRDARRGTAASPSALPSPASPAPSHTASATAGQCPGRQMPVHSLDLTFQARAGVQMTWLASPSCQGREIWTWAGGGCSRLCDPLARGSYQPLLHPGWFPARDALSPPRCKYKQHPGDTLQGANRARCSLLGSNLQQSRPCSPQVGCRQARLPPNKDHMVTVIQPAPTPSND